MIMGHHTPEPPGMMPKRNLNGKMMDLSDLISTVLNFMEL
jgi:hypothetical protein